MASPLKELSYGSVEIYTDETLGIGSYGKVCKAKCGQLPCAAKLLHDTMFQDNDPGINRFLEKFQQECQFLSTIKHPNIVQFLRTARNPETGRPILLMELMDESLTGFLERSTCTIPYHIQINICHDVALALAYLHSNSIIHRDLSSNNVLLIGAGSRAKVTDFGMSKLTDMNPHMTPLTLCPGTTVYMPPEALNSPPHYSNKLDCFSHGVLTIQIITQNLPDPTDATYIVKDSRYPTGQASVFIPEADRRKKDIDLIDPDYPLRPVALHCLKDIETERPSADDLCEQLASLKRERRYTQSVEQSRNQTASVQRLELELQRKTEEYQNAVDVKERYQRELEQSQLQYREAVDAKEQYQRELEQSQLQYQEAVDEKEGYRRELEQSQLQYREAVDEKEGYRRGLEQSQLQYRMAVDAKERHRSKVEQYQVQYRKALDAKEQYQREMEQCQVQHQVAVDAKKRYQKEVKVQYYYGDAVDAKERYQRAVEQYQMQYIKTIHAKQQYQSELEQCQVQYPEAVNAKELYESELEQSQLQYQEAVEEKERYQRELEQSQLQYQEAVDEKERYQRELEQSQLQYQKAVDEKEGYRRELEQSQHQEAVDAKERYQSELEQSQVQLKSCEVKREILQQQLRKELDDTRGEDVTHRKRSNFSAMLQNIKSKIKVGTEGQKLFDNIRMSNITYRERSKTFPVQGSQSKLKEDSVKLTWNKRKSAPEAMTSLIGTAVAHGNRVYFSASYRIYSFEYPEKWTPLQPSLYKLFGLAVVNEKLTTIGGRKPSSTIINTLFSLNEDGLWVKLLPAMPTERFNPAAVTTSTHLIVAGGSTSQAATAEVEVLDTKTHQWFTACSLPQVVANPPMTLCDGFLYLSNNINTVYSCSVEGLLVSANSSDGGSLWTELAEIPVRINSSIVTLGGRVLAISSKNCDHSQTGAIYRYDETTNSWNIIGEMPTPRRDVLTEVLPSNKLVVVGGQTEQLEHRTLTEIGQLEMPLFRTAMP